MKKCSGKLTNTKQAPNTRRVDLEGELTVAKTKGRAFGALVPLVICACVCAATALAAVNGAGLEVFPRAVEMNFPQGYDVYSDAGKLLKTVPGPTSATVQAKTSGKTFAVGEVYLSDWSYERMQKGDRPNWIVPKENDTAAAAAQVSASSAASIGLVVYPAIKEVTFPKGYNVFSDDGQLIKTVPGPTSIALKGEISGKTFANGTAYLSDWSYDQLQQGKSPNWVIPSGTAMDLAQDFSGGSNGLLIQIPENFIVQPLNIVTLDDCDLVSSEGQASGLPAATGATSVRVRALRRGLYLSDSEFEKMLSGAEYSWVRPDYLRPGSATYTTTRNSLASPVTPLKKISESIDLKEVIETHTSPGGNLKLSEAKQRGMLVRNAVDELADSHGFASSVYPDAVEATFPLGYRVFDDNGILVESIPGPVTTKVRAKVALSGVTLKSPSYEKLSSLTAKDIESLVFIGGTSFDGSVNFHEGINLNGVTELTPHAARALAAAYAKPSFGDPATGRLSTAGVGAISLDGLQSVSPELAEILANLPCWELSLGGLGALPPDVARILSTCEPYNLKLNGVKELCSEAAEALSTYKGADLEFDGLEHLSQEAATALSNYGTDLATLSLNGLTVLPAEVASALAQSKASTLKLNGLMSISDDAALALGRYRGNLELNQLKSISPNAARGLATSGPGPKGLARLSLHGISSLSPASLRNLSAYAGNVELNAPIEQAVETQAEYVSVFLADTEYEHLQNGESPKWIYSGELPGCYPRIFNMNGEQWAQVDSNLPWEQIDDWNAEGLVQDIIFSHHPLTSRTFSKIGLSRGGKAWDDIFEIDASSEGQELCGSSGDAIPPAIFDAFAHLQKKEREWFLSTLPGIYQAVADAFRRDLRPAVADEATKVHADNVPLLSDDDIYLEFYRSPCSFTGAGWKGGYRRWSELKEEERESAVKGGGNNTPSFYGLRVYRRGHCLDDLALFGGVDFEIFTELMLRNYTRRNMGLSLEQTDDWLQGCFKSIYAKIFGQLGKHLSGAKQIYWKASGYLHLVPLDLIAISCGEKDGIANIPMVEVADAAAIEKSSSFSKNLRQLGALLVANPEYNGENGQTAPESIYDDGTEKLVSRAFAHRSLFFQNLPGADKEVSQLANIVDSAGAGKVQMLRSSEATEPAVLEALSNCGMAHIATHGFYLDMTLATEESGKQLLNELKSSTNPYFRSGLALAGANITLAEWSKGNVKGSSTDGVLLASEVKNRDLKNLSLLVLSACSTAEGKPVDGKSVASLREAFLQSGVETLVATLWDIPDDFAAKLMGDFYRRLLAGETPSIALWHAKKDNFLELRKTTGFAESMVKVAPFVAVTQAAK